MPENQFDPQVILPYSTLCDLLQASVELKQIRIEMKRMKDEQARQRYQQVEIMEKVREIENSL